MSRATPRIAVIADGEREARILRRLVEQAGLRAEVSGHADLEGLGSDGGEEGGVDVVAWWPHRSRVTPEALGRCLRGMRHRPALLLVTQGIRAADYVLAARLGAGDVVDCGNPAQVGFALRRELGHADLRQRLQQARRLLEEERVIDEQALEPPDDTGTIPPLVHTLDRALQEDLFEIQFQPIVSLGDDAFESYEVFVRLPTPEGPLMPGQFMPTAAHYGLLPAIDRTVVARAVERFRQERAERPADGDQRSLRFFLNISAPTLMEAPAIRSILHLIADAHPAPGSFVIELDKKTILSRLRLAKSLNQFARRLRLEFAMDHYDVSDTKLNYTHHVRLDYIKLNRTLIDGIERRPEQRRQVEAICARARDCGIRVIASQVERMAELGPLYEAGIDYVQGNLVAEPSGRVEHDVDPRLVLDSNSFGPFAPG